MKSPRLDAHLCYQLVVRLQSDLLHLHVSWLCFPLLGAELAVS